MNRYAGIAWQGEHLKDFWMWNRQFNGRKGDIRHIQTVRVAELKEAALRYWRDGWIPIKPVDEGMLRRMEQALRLHRGLNAEGVRFPDAHFLKMPEEIPGCHYSPEVKELLGFKRDKAEGLKQETSAQGNL